MSRWIFGYGSLIWRPDFPYLERCIARAPGFARRFWQGSHDHRGVPAMPGRVVTLIASPSEHCDGMAYRLDPNIWREVIAHLDHREKNGYERVVVTVEPWAGNPSLQIDATTYLARPGNPAWLGESSLTDIAAQIKTAVGPSGRNLDYVLELANALAELAIDDAHVSELTHLLR